MQRWFKTKNSQLLDLNNFTAFWIVDYYGNYRIYGLDKENNQWILSGFEKEEEAKIYFLEIWGIMHES